MGRIATKLTDISVGVIKPDYYDGWGTIAVDQINPGVSILGVTGTYKKPTNCPNCGAPVSSDKCGYCGTIF